MATDDPHATDNSIAATLAAFLAPLAIDDALTADDLVAVVRDVAAVAGSAEAAPERADVERVLTGIQARAELRRRLREVCGAVTATGGDADAYERLLLHGASAARLAALDQVPDAALQVAPATLAEVLAQLTAIDERWSLADRGFPSEARRSALGLDHHKEIEALRDGGWLFGLVRTTSNSARGARSPGKQASAGSRWTPLTCQSSVTRTAVPTCLPDSLGSRSTEQNA